MARFAIHHGRSPDQLGPEEYGLKLWRTAPKYYIEYRDADGSRRRVPGFTDKLATAQLASELERQSARQQSGLVNRFAHHRNTLTAIIRQAWDGGNLRTLTKNSPTKATGAHVSIIGHITAEELRRYLDTTEACNGFGNRFLWVCVRRSKCLPDGGRLRDVDLIEVQGKLAEAFRFASQQGEMHRDKLAREIWHAVYPELSEGGHGLLGAVTSRAEAQVMRLALIYATLDCSSVIRAEHLKAGLAAWEYCEASARFIFGDALGDPVADEIVRTLRDRADLGMTRTDISNLLGRNTNTNRISRALALLQSCGRAHPVREDTGGRAAERWFIGNGSTA